MTRVAYAIVCMVAGVVVVATAAFLAFGIPAALLCIGIALVGVSVLLGWES